MELVGNLVSAHAIGQIIVLESASQSWEQLPDGQFLIKFNR